MAELGETTDARQLVPGDPDAVEHDVSAMRNRAQTMERGGESLKQIDTGAWTGEAAATFRDQFSYEPARWLRAADSFTTAANTLAEYADVLRWAQRQAAEAITVFHEGETATRQAKAAHEAAAEQQRADPSNHGPPPPFSDPGEAKRDAARDMLARARNQLAEPENARPAPCAGKATLRPNSPGGKPSSTGPGRPWASSAMSVWASGTA